MSAASAFRRRSAEHSLIRPRSPAGPASGRPRPWPQMTPAAQGPMPGSAMSRRRTASVGAAVEPVGRERAGQSGQRGPLGAGRGRSAGAIAGAQPRGDRRRRAGRAGRQRARPTAPSTRRSIRAASTAGRSWPASARTSDWAKLRAARRSQRRTAAHERREQPVALAPSAETACGRRRPRGRTAAGRRPPRRSGAASRTPSVPSWRCQTRARAGPASVRSATSSTPPPSAARRVAARRPRRPGGTGAAG